MNGGRIVRGQTLNSTTLSCGSLTSELLIRRFLIGHEMYPFIQNVVCGFVDVARRASRLCQIRGSYGPILSSTILECPASVTLSKCVHVRHRWVTPTYLLVHAVLTVLQGCHSAGEQNHLGKNITRIGLSPYRRFSTACWHCRLNYLGLSLRSYG